MFNLNAVLNVVGANTASVRAAVSDINSEMDRGTRKARNFADAVALQGTKLGAYTAASLAVIKLTESISAATRDAIRFEVEMVKVAQTVGISTEEAKKHGEEIRNLSVLYGLSAPKIAETVKILGQAGYTLRQAKEAADSLAQTTLLASFESISDTTDGLIAVNKQFIDTVGKSAQVLSVFNVVSKKYAVESSDLVEVVRKAGGTFSATGGSLEELLAVFTTVRDTTRESAETIAVGLRTIFSRLQRPKTIEYLKQFGIELVNLEGQFVGNFEAIQRIQKGLDAFGVRPGSIQFAQVVEQIGGVLQQSRVIPLLTQGAKLQRVYSDAQTATSQTAIDLAKAQDTLSFKIAQTQQNFAKLIGDIAGSKGFDTLARGVISITNAMIGFGSAIKDVIPLISALLAFNLAKSVGRLSIGGIGSLTGKKFASGGFVPGSGNGDTVPAMLTPGEFVIRKSAAQALGAEALHGINRYAGGGRVSVNANSLGSSELRKRVVKSDYADRDFKSGKAINDFDNINLRIVPKYFNGTPKMGNSDFEQFVAGETNGEWTGKDPNYPVDIINAPGIGPIEARNRNKTTSPSELADKLIRYRLKNGQNPLSNRNAKDEIDIGQITVAYNSEKLQKKKASGGGISGTDTVPSLLTPGEFVVNKKSAQAFGYGNLHKVNKYASGGVVGVQRFASGGVVGGMIPGLEGLGDLAIVVNQLIPTLGSMTSSFAKLSVAASITTSGLSGIFSAGKGVSGFLTAYSNEVKRLSEVRQVEYNEYKLAVETHKKTTQELRAATTASIIATIRPDRTKDINSASKAARLSVSRSPFDKKPVLDNQGEIDARKKLIEATQKLVAEYGRGSDQVKEATNIYNSLKGSLKDQADAIDKYTELVIQGQVAERALVETLREREAAEEKAAEVAGAKVNTGGIRGKIGAGFRVLSAEGPEGEALRGKVQAGIATAGAAVITASAYFASSARTAAQELNSLSSAAVAAGNSQEAYDQSIAASAKEAQAAGIETGTSAGGVVGSAVAGIAGGIASFFFPPLAPLIPLFISLGGVVGSAIGGFLGFAGAITAFTDFLGFTNSEQDAKIKAQEQERSAALVKADKISSAALTKSSDIRKFNPKAADAILLKGVRDFIDNNDAESSIANKDLQDQAKALFDAASSSIEELSQKSENVGKSFAQLRAENRDVFLAWQESGEIIEGNKERMLAQQRQHDAVAQLSAKEIRAREDAIAVLLQQIGIQERVNQSLLRMDRVANAQKDLMGQLDIALGGGLSSREIGSDLTNMDSRNTNSDAFKRGLDAVSRIGPEFAQTSNDISRTISAVRGIGTTVAQKKNLTADQIKEDILDDLKLKGLSPSIIKSIDSAIDGMGDNIDASAIESVILDKAVKPLAEGLEPARKAINEQLDNQLTILKKLSEIDQNRLAIALSGFEASLKTIRSIDKILGVEADPMFERGARLTKGNINLQGTSLQGLPLTGGAQDIARIADQIKQNELKKLDIERRIGEADPNTKFGLQQEFTDLASETDKLKAAMVALSDVNEENAALEEKLAKSRANREAVRGAATDLAFGTNKDRQQFFKTLNQARGVAFTGSAEIVNPEDRGAVKSFLTTFKNLPAFAGGQTGQQVLDNATRNYLVNQVGVPLDQVDLVMKDFTRSEMDTVELIRENLTIDEKRNDLLGKILEAVSRDIGFNAPNMALPRRGQAGPFLGLAGFATGGKADENSSKIFKPKGSDTVPAMLTPGEFIVSAKYAKRNMRVLTEINSGSTKYLEKGTDDDPLGIRAMLREQKAKAEYDEKAAADQKERERKAASNTASNTSSFADTGPAFYKAQAEKEAQAQREREAAHNADLARSKPKTVSGQDTSSVPQYAPLYGNGLDPASTSKIMKEASTISDGRINEAQNKTALHFDKKASALASSKSPLSGSLTEPIRPSSPLPFTSGKAKTRTKISPRKPVFSEPFTLPPPSMPELPKADTPPDQVYRPLAAPTITDTKTGTSSLGQLQAVKEAAGPLDKQKGPKKQTDMEKIQQLQKEREAIGRDYRLGGSEASATRLSKRTDRQRERIDKRIEKLNIRRGETKTPQMSADLHSAPPIPNLQSQASSNPAGFISGGRFSQPPQGISGGQTGQAGQTNQDFSSLTSSLEAFNTGFSASVKELASIPKEFKHTITMPTMSITLNGAEFIAKLPEEMKRIITDQIIAETPTIIKKATAEITNGGIGAFAAGGKNSTRPAKT